VGGGAYLRGLSMPQRMQRHTGTARSCGIALPACRPWDRITRVVAKVAAPQRSHAGGVVVLVVLSSATGGRLVKPAPAVQAGARPRYRPGVGPPRMLWTIGYERFGRPEGLVEALVAAGIERVCDVRAVAQSRRRGFSRTALQEVLADAGIVYEHWPELGNPADLRRVFRDGRLEEGRQRFRDRLRERYLWAVDSLAESAGERPTAMLCREDDPGLCHRDAVPEELARRHPGVAVVRL
jgi:hypothetical protein